MWSFNDGWLDGWMDGQTERQKHAHTQCHSVADPGFFESARGGAHWDLVRFDHVHAVYSSMKQIPFAWILKELSIDTKYTVVWPTR